VEVISGSSRSTFRTRQSVIGFRLGSVIAFNPETVIGVISER
jgi:hypothetical protein